MNTPLAHLITTPELSGLRSAQPGVHIIDVRTAGEFDAAHIPGSYNVPLDTLSEHAGELAVIQRPVVLVCQSGGRATQAHGGLESAGKRTVQVLEGGMNAWLAAGGDVTRGDTSHWAMDRQVRLVAGALVLGGVVASTLVPKAKWLSGAVAGGLVFSAVTDTCAMAAMLAKLPYNRSTTCDVDAIVGELTQQAA